MQADLLLLPMCVSPYTTATDACAGANALGDALPSEAFKWVAIVGTILLIILWLGVAFGTIKHGVQGRLFTAPCLSTAPTEDKSWVSSEGDELG